MALAIAPSLTGPDHIPHRLALLVAETMVVRHAGAARLAADLVAMREAIAKVAVDNTCEATARGMLLDKVDRLGTAVAVAAECADGDVSCYVANLASAAPDAARKAALLAAWTAAPAVRSAARTALLGKLTAPTGARGALQYESIHREVDLVAHALAILATSGCPECGDAIGAASAANVPWKDRARLAWVARHAGAK